MAKFSEIKNYFEGLATDFLSHSVTNKCFFRENEELTNFPCMVVNYYSSNISGEQDAYFEARNFSFDIIDHLHDTEDDTRIDEILDNTETIALNILNQIYRDFLDRNIDFCVDFDLTSCSWNFIIDQEDHRYGCKVNLSMFVQHTIMPLTND